MACTIPATIGAGLTFDTLLTLPAFPAPEWSLSLMLRGASTIDLAATAENNQHRFRANAAATGAWAPGTYWFSLRATRGDEVVEVESGQLVVTPDMAAAPEGFDGRTPAQIALEAIEAVLAKRATMDQERYRINNRELYRTPIAELIRLRNLYREEVRREQRKGCGQNPFGGVVRVRFK